MRSLHNSYRELVGRWVIIDANKAPNLYTWVILTAVTPHFITTKLIESRVLELLISRLIMLVNMLVVDPSAYYRFRICANINQRSHIFSYLCLSL